MQFFLCHLAHRGIDNSPLRRLWLRFRRFTKACSVFSVQIFSYESVTRIFTLKRFRNRLFTDWQSRQLFVSLFFILIHFQIDISVALWRRPNFFAIRKTGLLANELKQFTIRVFFQSDFTTILFRWTTRFRTKR